MNNMNIDTFIGTLVEGDLDHNTIIDFVLTQQDKISQLQSSVDSAWMQTDKAQKDRSHYQLNLIKAMTGRDYDECEVLDAVRDMRQDLIYMIDQAVRTQPDFEWISSMRKKYGVKR